MLVQRKRKTAANAQQPGRQKRKAAVKAHTKLVKRAQRVRSRDHRPYRGWVQVQALSDSPKLVLYFCRSVCGPDGNEVWVFLSRHGYERAFLRTSALCWEQVTCNTDNLSQKARKALKKAYAAQEPKLGKLRAKLRARPVPALTVPWATMRRVRASCPMQVPDASGDGEHRCGATVECFPFCNDCLNAHLHLRVGPSTIPGANLGVFLTEDVVKGRMLVGYHGEIVTNRTEQLRYSARGRSMEAAAGRNPHDLPRVASYTMAAIGMNVKVNALHMRGVGAMVNCCGKDNPANVDFVQWCPKRQEEAVRAGALLPEERAITFLQANCNMVAGTELFADYGWDNQSF